jgi:hypothetical protein
LEEWQALGQRTRTLFSLVYMADQEKDSNIYCTKMTTSTLIEKNLDTTSSSFLHHGDVLG